MKTDITKVSHVPTKGRALEDFRASQILGHLAYRFRFELAVLYGVATTTWYIVTYWSVAWQNFK